MSPLEELLKLTLLAALLVLFKVVPVALLTVRLPDVLIAALWVTAPPAVKLIFPLVLAMPLFTLTRATLIELLSVKAKSPLVV